MAIPPRGSACESCCFPGSPSLSPGDSVNHRAAWAAFFVMAAGAPEPECGLAPQASMVCLVSPK